MNPRHYESWIDHSLLFRLLALGYLMLVAVTWPLWIPQTVFPQVPLISMAAQIPSSVEWSLLIALLAALGGMLLIGKQKYCRWAALLTAICTIGLVCLDQHRLQPWVWQFLILSLVLAAADASTARTVWRWLVIGIYAWSGWSKLDQGFYFQHGPFLLEGLFKSLGLINVFRFWPETIRFAAAGMIPLFELLIAAGLCWPRTRRLAVYAAALMHVGLLLALGPFGHSHQPGVLVWNVFFLSQNWMLFCGVNQSGKVIDGPLMVGAMPTDRTARIRNSLARLVVIAALIWPVLEPFGLCDHWPAWAVYAARPERVTVYLAEEEVEKLPANLKQYVGSQMVFDEWYEWHPFRIDRWSLDEVYVPLYPQDRFQVGVALGLVRRLQLQKIRIIIEGPAYWWIGKRSVREYVGPESIEKLADSFRFGARPRL